MFFLAYLPQFTTPAEPQVLQLVLLGSIRVALNTMVDAMAVLGAQRRLKTRVARARLVTRVKELEDENRPLRKMYLKEKRKAEIAKEHLAKK